jgi:mRNA interferase MazF
MTRPLAIGDVLKVSLPQQNPPGHEQEGYRPAVVVGIIPGPMRYPMVLVVPTTTHTGQTWAAENLKVYPLLKAGSGSLTVDSIVLLDQLRSVDLGRIGAYMGTLNPEEYAPIHEGLVLILGLKK